MYTFVEYMYSITKPLMTSAEDDNIVKVNASSV